MNLTINLNSIYKALNQLVDENILEKRKKSALSHKSFDIYTIPENIKDFLSSNDSNGNKKDLNFKENVSNN